MDGKLKPPKPQLDLGCGETECSNGHTYEREYKANCCSASNSELQMYNYIKYV